VVVRDEASELVLRLARDKAGEHLLPTAEETAKAERDTARAESEAARAESEAARTERNAALERVRILEEEIAKRR
jgi:uncharacterized protein (DUF3084 family)